jgi:hypothetical protein
LVSILVSRGEPKKSMAFQENNEIFNTVSEFKDKGKITSQKFLIERIKKSKLLKFSLLNFAPVWQMNGFVIQENKDQGFQEHFYQDMYLRAHKITPLSKNMSEKLNNLKFILNEENCHFLDSRVLHINCEPGEGETVLSSETLENETIILERIATGFYEGHVFNKNRALISDQFYVLNFQFRLKESSKRLHLRFFSNPNPMDSKDNSEDKGALTSVPTLFKEIESKF